MNKPVSRQPWIQWGLGLAVWTLIGLSFASQLYLTQSKLGAPLPWKFALGHALADWYVFALLSLPAFRVAKRFRLEGAQWPRHTLIHWLASAAFSLLWMILRAGMEALQAGDEGAWPAFQEAFQQVLFKTFFFNLLIYWAIVSVSHALEYYERFHERELRASDLEKRLTEARLQALQMQLNPHFLFNTLHAISALMHKDVEAADRMLTRLGELLRYALESTDEQEVSLRQELKFLERYLEIEQTRFGERLSIIKKIDPLAAEALVPNLILQPLLENAIQHGVEMQSKPGVIELTAVKENGRVRLLVRDNGAGVKTGPIVEGVGLSNTRSRLQQLYGESRHQFVCENAPGGGFQVTISLPFRTQHKPHENQNPDSG